VDGPVLELRSTQLDARVRDTGDRIGKLQDQHKLLGEQLDAFSRLEEFFEFEDLDWGAVANEIAILTDERRRLETASDLLQQLNERLVQSTGNLAATEQALDIAKDRRSRISQHMAHASEVRRLAQAVVESVGQARLLSPDELARRLDQARSEALGESVVASIDASDHHEQETRAYLQGLIDALRGRRDALLT